MFAHKILMFTHKMQCLSRQGYSEWYAPLGLSFHRFLGGPVPLNFRFSPSFQKDTSNGGANYPCSFLEAADGCAASKSPRLIPLVAQINQPSLPFTSGHSRTGRQSLADMSLSMSLPRSLTSPSFNHVLASPFPVAPYFQLSLPV